MFIDFSTTKKLTYNNYILFVKIQIFLEVKYFKMYIQLSNQKSFQFHMSY